MEISDDKAAFTEDFEEKLADAQTQLEVLQTQRAELERQKIALEDLNQRKQEFMNGQLDLTERFATSITNIEREIFESKQELDDLDQTRAAFVNHLNRIESLNPEAWPKDALSTVGTRPPWPAPTDAPGSPGLPDWVPGPSLSEAKQSEAVQNNAKRSNTK